MGTLWYSERQHCIFIKRLILHIGVGTREGRGGGGNILPSRLVNIHTCSTDHCDRSVYYVCPPQNGIASYAYVTSYKLEAEDGVVMFIIIT